MNSSSLLEYIRESTEYLKEHRRRMEEIQKTQEILAKQLAELAAWQTEQEVNRMNTSQK